MGRLRLTSPLRLFNIRRRRRGRRTRIRSFRELELQTNLPSDLLRRPRFDPGGVLKTDPLVNGMGLSFRVVFLLDLLGSTAKPSRPQNNAVSRSPHILEAARKARRTRSSVDDEAYMKETETWYPPEFCTYTVSTG